MEQGPLSKTAMLCLMRWAALLLLFPLAPTLPGWHAAANPSGHQVPPTEAEADVLAIESDLLGPLVGWHLSYQEALEGWLSLFDGTTTFGWKDASCHDHALHGGSTTSRFGPCDVRAWCVQEGWLSHGDQQHHLSPGTHMFSSQATGTLALAGGLRLSGLVVKPRNLAPLFNGRDLEGWQRIDRRELPEARRPRWEVVNRAIRAQGGPGALETQTLLGDLVIQVQARTHRHHTNGGVFFRCQPGLFMMGYEAQILNRCREHDPLQPIGWTTGAIDDRQAARRLVSPDGRWFLLTVVADGPHVATWVNGLQLVDWTDERTPHDNPREGRRLAPGTIQLQAHDPQTDLEFRSVAAAPLK